MPQPEEVVREFCDLMVKRDAEALRRYFADDVVYQNVGMEPTVGVDATIEFMAGQFAMFPETYAFDTIHCAADGDVVLTERVDYVNDFDGKRHGLPVMGTFVLQDGKITRWTDYWDSALIGKMLSGEAYATLVPQH